MNQKFKIRVQGHGTLSQRFNSYEEAKAVADEIEKDHPNVFAEVVECQSSDLDE